MTKKVITFFEKNRVTPSVTAPGDTNVSDATASTARQLEKWRGAKLRTIVSEDKQDF